VPDTTGGRRHHQLARPTVPRSLGYLLLLLGAASLVGAWSWLSADDVATGDGGGRPPYVLPVTLAQVQRGDVQPSVRLTGSVRSARWARMAFELSGTLVELQAQEADAVPAGQILARLDDQDQRLALASFEASRLVAQRELERARAGERDEEIKRLAAQLVAAEAEEQLADLEVERRRELAAASDVSRAEMDRVQATQRGASARRQAVAEQLAQAQAGTRAEDLAIAEARLAQADAARDRAARELAKTVLRAPWDGVVIRRHRSTGDFVRPGDVLFELADLQHLEIDVEVPSTYALRLGLQPDVIVRVDEAPELALHTSLHASVPSADLVSRNFRGIVRLDADAAGGVLRPGMFARLQLMLANVPDALVVPADAVRTTERGTIVVVADAAESGEGLVGRFVPVRVLGSEAARTAVAPLAPDEAPLSSGDRVIVTGVDLAYPGVALLPRAPGDGDRGAPGGADAARTDADTHSDRDASADAGASGDESQ